MPAHIRERGTQPKRPGESVNIINNNSSMLCLSYSNNNEETSYLESLCFFYTGVIVFFL